MMKKFMIVLIAIFLLFTLSACGTVPEAPEAENPGNPTGEPGFDQTYQEKEGVEVIYLAGGCFWGLEKLMQTLPGVLEATSGYANGQGVNPTYAIVSKGKSGYRETVRVEYEPYRVSLDLILFTYFSAIDPTIKNKQGNDIGTQYQTGIYCLDDASKAIVERIADVERGRYKPFEVEIKPLISFYDAEEYHQEYLDKNPSGYCHITQEEFSLAEKAIIDPAKYPRPSEEIIVKMLTKTQYDVTQKASTEPAFNNEFWKSKEKGIYVDVVTGEPLFSSKDKFDSGTGWPSFSKGIDENVLILMPDKSMGMVRSEVRSRAGDSHLGHVFYGEAKSPTGVRFCMNSAALRFIPFDEMEEEGYGYLKEVV